MKAIILRRAVARLWMRFQSVIADYGSACFFPCRQEAAFLAEDKKCRLMPSSAAPRVEAAGRSLPGPRIAIEAAMGAARAKTESTMATIGTFTASDNGFVGSIKTLTLNIKARFAASEKENDKGPRLSHLRRRHRLCGAAWKKTARETDSEYLSVKLDDPSFPAQIYASLVKVDGDEGFTLIWSRRNSD
jgi:uncharacterized protein (DUF736 family)